MLRTSSAKEYYMPKTNKDVLSDDRYLRYKRDVAETEALIAAVRASRERAEKFANNTFIRGCYEKKRTFGIKIVNSGSHK